MTKLNFKNGRLWFYELEITPPYELSTEWESLIKKALPNFKSGYGDYQRWAGYSFGCNMLKLFDDFELDIYFSYKCDWTIKETPKLQRLYIVFSDNSLENYFANQGKLKHHEKLKIIKLKYIELLEKMTEQKLEIKKRNVIQFSNWGNALLSIKKNKYYELTISWNYKELRNNSSKTKNIC